MTKWTIQGFKQFPFHAGQTALLAWTRQILSITSYHYKSLPLSRMLKYQTSKFTRLLMYMKHYIESRKRGTHITAALFQNYHYESAFIPLFSVFFFHDRQKCPSLHN